MRPCARSCAISEKHPRWGYRRAHAELLLEGWSVNRKRVQRIWREEGLRVPSRKRKRRRAGTSTAEGGAKRLRATHPGHVWAVRKRYRSPKVTRWCQRMSMA